VKKQQGESAEQLPSDRAEALSELSTRCLKTMPAAVNAHLKNWIESFFSV
jgi:hypothetical protein